MSKNTWIIPCNVAKFHSDPLRKFPVWWEHRSKFVLKLQQMFLEPYISSVNFIQPSCVLCFLEQVTVFCQLESNEPLQQITPKRIYHTQLHQAIRENYKFPPQYLLLKPEDICVWEYVPMRTFWWRKEGWSKLYNNKHNQAF